MTDLSQNITTVSPTQTNLSPDHKADDVHEAEIMRKAQEFEAVFISQMLKFSGLDKALTLNGGEDVSAFAGFYIDQFADKISQKGGFGLAEKIYAQMSRLNKGDTVEQGEQNVHANKL